MYSDLIKNLRSSNLFVSKVTNLRRRGKSLLISMISQIVSSLTNFGITLYLVRILVKEEFGFYGLGFALMLMLAGLITAMICVQLVVNLPDQPTKRRARYAMHHVVAVGLTGTLLIFSALIFIWLTNWLSLDKLKSIMQLVMPVTIAAAFYSIRDVLMRIAYSERCEKLVLLSNVAVGLAVVIAFSGFYKSNFKMTAELSMYIYAFGQLAGSVQGLFKLKLPWHVFNWKELRQAILESWKGGRWSVITNIIYNLRTQAHNFIVTPILGIAALGEINAARVLVTPAVMAIAPITQIIMPRLSEKRGQGIVKLLNAMLIANGGLFLISIFYSIVLILSLPWLLPLTLGENYRNIDELIMAWCVTTIFLVLRNGLATTLEVLRAFKSLMVANFISAVLALSVGFFLVKQFGALGAIYSLALAEFILCLTLSVMIIKKISRERIKFLS